MYATKPWELSAEPVPIADAERTPPVPRSRSIGRVRLPIAGPYRPWARLFELPDGRRLWCVRLWEVDRPVRRCFSTGVLIAFARLNRLDRLRSELEAVARRP